MMPIVVLDVRRDLTRGPLANRLLEQLLFVCQVEADHMSRESYHALRRTLHHRAATQTERRRGASAVDRDLQPIRAADQRAQLARRRVGVGGTECAGSRCEPIRTVTVPDIFPSVGSVDVRHQISEAVDAQHFTVDAGVRQAWPRHVESRAARTAGRPSAVS